MNDLTLLWQLQGLEVKLTEINTEVQLKEVKNNINRKKNEHKELKDQLYEKVAHYKELEKRITRAHLKNKNLSYEIKELQEKLYNGSINNLKLYSKMEREIEEYKKDNESIENNLIGYMEEIEELEKNILKMKKRLVHIQDIYQEERVRYHQKKDQLNNQLLTIDREIKKLLANIDETFIMEYRTIKQRIQPALAKIENGVCSGCHMNLSIILLKEIQNSKKVYTCESCGRILYMEEN